MFHTITAAAVDVQQLKTETLPLLKIEVQGEHLGEAGVPTAGDHFSAVHLKKSNPGHIQIPGSSHNVEAFLLFLISTIMLLSCLLPFLKFF